MDHDRAIELHAVDRYLLGDMTAEERDSFEEHYFGCAECAGEVRAGARLRANAREVLGEPGTERAAGWRRWFGGFPRLVPLAASVALLGVVLYQNAVTIPGLRAPRTLAVPVTLDGVTRGSAPRVGRGQALDFLIAAPAGGEVVTPELASESGKVLARGAAAKAVPDQPYHVYFPGEYGPGRYAIILRDAATGRELARNQFEIAAEETNQQ